MAKKKKRLEDDAWMWMTQPFVAGLQSLQTSGANIPSVISSRGRRKSSPAHLPYTANPYMLRQVFNIPAYIVYGTLLPTPLEQIAFAKDPLGIVPPYVWKGGFHAILDVSSTVADPFGVARSQLQSPHEATFGRPNPNYWSTPEGQAMTELFQASGY